MPTLLADVELSKYLAQLLKYATLIGAFVALISGALQVRQWRRARELSVALELVHTIKTPHFTDCIARVLQLPAGESAARVRDDPQLVEAAYVVMHAFESLGVLVFEHMLPLRFVDQLLGGYAHSSWARLQSYVLDGRRIYGPTFGEWYQWLVERLLERGAGAGGPGANTAHQSWRPRG